MAEPAWTFCVLVLAIILRPFAMERIKDDLYLRNRRHDSSGLTWKIYWLFVSLVCLPFFTAAIALGAAFFELSFARFLYDHRYWTLYAFVAALPLYAWFVMPIATRRT